MYGGLELGAWMLDAMFHSTIRTRTAVQYIRENIPGCQSRYEHCPVDTDILNIKHHTTYRFMVDVQL